MQDRDRTPDHLSIERLVASLSDAWARGDADAYANRFANDGTFTNYLGMFFQGREAFRDRHNAVFRTVFKGSVLSLRIATLRFIRPDVAIADLEAELRGLTIPPAGLSIVNGTVRTQLLMVLVKEEGDWWISAYHNVAVAPSQPRFASR